MILHANDDFEGPWICTQDDKWVLDEVITTEGRMGMIYCPPPMRREFNWEWCLAILADLAFVGCCVWAAVAWWL